MNNLFCIVNKLLIPPSWRQWQNKEGEVSEMISNSEKNLWKSTSFPSASGFQDRLKLF